MPLPAQKDVSELCSGSWQVYRRKTGASCALTSGGRKDLAWPNLLKGGFYTDHKGALPKAYGAV